MNRKEKAQEEFKALPKEEQTAEWWKSYHEETDKIEAGAKKLIETSLTPEMKAALYDMQSQITYWISPSTGELEYMISDWGCGCCGGESGRDTNLETLLRTLKVG